MEKPDWATALALALGLDDTNYGLLTFTGFSVLVATIVLIVTAIAIWFGRNQFRIGNTIKYLEEFRSSRFKRVIDRVRKADVENGHHWRVYGLMTGVVELINSRNRIEVPEDEPRIKFAIEAKQISHYFDYAAILIKRGHIDHQLFFQQLGEVVIDNWRFLQPYIYYQRLARFDRFAHKHVSYYDEGLAALKTDPSIPEKTVTYLSRAVAALKSVHELPTRRPRGQTGPGVLAASDLTALDDQIWFEQLYMKALKWRDGQRKDKRQYAPPDQIRDAIVRVGKKAAAPVSAPAATSEPTAA